MNNRVLNFIIGVRDNASGAFRKIGAGLSWLAGRARAAVSMLASLPAMLASGAFAAGIARAVKSFMEAEQSSRRLAAALATAGAPGTAARFERIADALQRITGVDDEAIKNAMGLALNLGVKPEDLEDVTKAALGLSKAYGVDLNAAMQAFGRTAAGVSARVAMFGIDVAEGATPLQTMQLLLARGRDGFAQFEVTMGGLAGAWTRLRNAVGDAMERIGGAIAQGLGLEGFFDRLRVKIDSLDFAGLRERLAIVKAQLEDLFSADPEKRKTAAQDMMNMAKAAFQTAGGAAVEVLLKAAPMIGALLGAGARAAFELTGIPKAHRTAQAEGELVGEGKLENTIGTSAFFGYTKTRDRSTDEQRLIEERAAEIRRRQIEERIKGEYGNLLSGPAGSPWDAYWKEQEAMRPVSIEPPAPLPTITPATPTPPAPAAAAVEAVPEVEAAADDIEDATDDVDAARREYERAMRDNAFAAATPEGRRSMLRAEIDALNRDADAAAASGDEALSYDLRAAAEGKAGDLAGINRQMAEDLKQKMAKSSVGAVSVGLGDVFTAARGQNAAQDPLLGQSVQQTELLKRLLSETEKGVIR